MTLIVLAGWLATGCAADDGNETMPSGNSGQPMLAAQAVDLTLNPGWEWRMEEANTLFVIRSAEELAAHVTGGEGVAAEVDFSRYSVLSHRAVRPTESSRFLKPTKRSMRDAIF